MARPQTHELMRRPAEELDQLKKQGIDPFPYEFDRTAYSAQNSRDVPG